MAATAWAPTLVKGGTGGFIVGAGRDCAAAGRAFLGQPRPSCPALTRCRPLQTPALTIRRAAPAPRRPLAAPVRARGDDEDRRGGPPPLPSGEAVIDTAKNLLNSATSFVPVRQGCRGREKVPA